jgi:hypothetical protein
VTETIVRAEHAGLSAWCNGARTQGSYNQKPVFISLFGVQSSVRAIWAALSGKKTSIRLGDEHYRLADENYTTLRSLTAKQWLHVVMILDSATSVVSPFEDSFYVVSEDPISNYWSRFNRMCPVPMRSEWRDVVWDLGREAGLISPLDGFGIPGFSVKVGSEWAPVIQKALREKVLS